MLPLLLGDISGKKLPLFTPEVLRAAALAASLLKRNSPSSSAISAAKSVFPAFYAK